MITMSVTIALLGLLMLLERVIKLQFLFHTRHQVLNIITLKQSYIYSTSIL